MSIDLKSLKNVSAAVAVIELQSMINEQKKILRTSGTHNSLVECKIDVLREAIHRITNPKPVRIVNEREHVS